MRQTEGERGASIIRNNLDFCFGFFVRSTFSNILGKCANNFLHLRV